MEVMNYRTGRRVTKFTPLSEMSEAFRSYRDYLENDPERGGKLERAARLLTKAIETDLSACQQACVRLYYFERRTQQEIAELLSLNQSSVSRSLKSARKRLQLCLKYVFV